MTDECIGCTLRGDLKACKSTDCFQHKNWYSIEQQKIIDEQRMVIIDMRASLRTCFNSSQSALDQYGNIDS